MPELEIEIEGAHPMHVLKDDQKPEGVKVAYLATRHEFSQQGISAVQFVFEFGTAVSVNVLAGYILHLILKHSAKGSKHLKIDRRVVEINEGEITKIIEEKIRYSKKK